MSIEIIAEISGCHGGSLENAKKLIVEAHVAGATGVKFQCFEPTLLAGKRSFHPRVKNAYSHAALAKLYVQTHTPREWFPELIAWAKEGGLTWHASVFDPDDVTFLETLDCPRYKISSFETYDDNLLAAVKETGKPLIISYSQDDNFLVAPSGVTTILHATNYAVPASAAKLRRLRHWAWTQGDLPRGQFWQWGLSDHTTDHYAAEIAATLGAKMIEWHLKLPGVETPDDAFSWAWKAFEMKAERVREIEEILRG